MHRSLICCVVMSVAALSVSQEAKDKKLIEPVYRSLEQVFAAKMKGADFAKKYVSKGFSFNTKHLGNKSGWRECLQDLTQPATSINFKIKKISKLTANVYSCQTLEHLVYPEKSGDKWVDKSLDTLWVDVFEVSSNKIAWKSREIKS